MKPTKCRLCGKPHTRTIASDRPGERMPALRCLACVSKVNPERARRDLETVRTERAKRVAGYCPHTGDLVDELEVSVVGAGRAAA